MQGDKDFFQKGSMPDLPSIAVFADTKAQRDYLAALVRAAGFSVLSDSAIAGLGLALQGAKELSNMAQDYPVFILGEDLPIPARAAQVIEALHRLGRQQTALPAELRIGAHILDTRENIFILKDAGPVRLTEKETAILACLKQAQGTLLPREALLARVWSYATGVETHTLETHIYRLRQKIEKDPSRPEILLTKEDGYCLQE